MGDLPRCWEEVLVVPAAPAVRVVTSRADPLRGWVELPICGVGSCPLPLSLGVWCREVKGTSGNIPRRWGGSRVGLRPRGSSAPCRGG
jgi:hypothetical protein